jgi:hypothetical protein
LLSRQSKCATGKVTGDVHPKDGSGKAKISHDEMLADVCLGGGDPFERIGDNEDVVDVDKKNADVTSTVMQHYIA